MPIALRLFVLFVAVVACIKACYQPLVLTTQMTMTVSNDKTRTTIQYGILSNGELGYLVFAISKDRAGPLTSPVRHENDQGELVLPNGDKIRLPASDKIFEIKDGAVTRSRTAFSTQDVLDYLESRPDEYSIDGLTHFVQDKQ